MHYFAARLSLHLKPLSRLFHRLLCLGGVFVISVGSVATIYACELKESSIEESDVFLRHLIGSCTAEEREALAISTDSLFQAIQVGKNVDLQGVVIIGNLMFDQLPLQPISAPSLPSVVAQRIVAERRIRQARIIPGSISVRDSVIQGNWATNLRNEVLIIAGNVFITGTTFQQSVDFSQTVFLRNADFSNSNIRYEGFFIRTHFEEQANFDEVMFGTHTRFHRGRFSQDVSFLKSQFAGLAEFLEVTFEKRAYFANSKFLMGTGFSGAVFSGPSNFSETEFHRETFFRFASFQQAANFHDATFKEVSDFTEVKFAETPDFSSVEFLVSPNFSGTKIEHEWNTKSTNEHVREYLVTGLTFLGFLCVFIWGIRKWRQSS